MTDQSRHEPPSSLLDDGYRPFLEALTSAGPIGEVSVAQLRKAAARVRLPWQAGGPRMHEVAEASIGTPHGPARVRTYYPVSRRPLPTLVYFHGGGWALLDIDTHDRIMREYASASGWAVVGFNYPRAPETRFPETVTACRSLVQSVMSSADAGQTIALAGDSSGANLALAVALAKRDDGEHNVQALILNYGVYDGSVAGSSYAAFSGPPFTLTRERMTWFWDLYCPDRATRRHPLASPLNADLHDLPPIRMVTTGLDVLRDENLALLVRLFEAGNSVSLDHHPHAPHAFLEAVALHDEAVRAIAQSAVWLNAMIGRGR